VCTCVCVCACVCVCLSLSLSSSTQRERERERERERACSDLPLKTLTASACRHIPQGQIDESINQSLHYSSNQSHRCVHRYIPQGTPDPPQKGSVIFETHNIVTVPVRKGGFGIPNTTIGCPNTGAERRSWLATVH
jgi:hypothetical protein